MVTIEEVVSELRERSELEPLVKHLGNRIPDLVNCEHWGIFVKLIDDGFIHTSDENTTSAFVPVMWDLATSIENSEESFFTQDTQEGKASCFAVRANGHLLGGVVVAMKDEISKQERESFQRIAQELGEIILPYRPTFFLEKQTSYLNEPISGHELAKIVVPELNSLLGVLSLSLESAQKHLSTSPEKALVRFKRAQSALEKTILISARVQGLLRTSTGRVLILKTPKLIETTLELLTMGRDFKYHLEVEENSYLAPSFQNDLERFFYSVLAEQTEVKVKVFVDSQQSQVIEIRGNDIETMKAVASSAPARRILEKAEARLSLSSEALQVKFF